jgi:hypothetical protein
MNPTQQQVVQPRYFTKKSNTTYIPVEDGFVTSSGNPELAAKYGNNLGANVITNQIVNESIKIEKKT